jgi:hypothetical protein
MAPVHERTIPTERPPPVIVYKGFNFDPNLEKNRVHLLVETLFILLETLFILLETLFILLETLFILLETLFLTLI